MSTTTEKIRLAHLHLQMADVYRQKSNLEGAVAEFTHAIEIYKEMAREEPACWSLVADTIESIAATYKAAGQLDKAEATFREAIDLRRRLAE